MIPIVERAVALGMPSEKNSVEQPLIDQLTAMGWNHLSASAEGRPTERDSRRDVVLHGRLRAALHRINTADGEPWLDDQRLSQAANALLRPKQNNLLEINQELTNLLVNGTEVDPLPDAPSQRARHVDYIDWQRPERNDFVVVRQFVVELPGSQGRRVVEPDLVLFVNGLPLVVIETKAPHEQLVEAIDQLRRYANQRASKAESEGSERLFWINQLVIGSNYDRAEAATFTADAEHYAAWKTVEPCTEDQVRTEVGKSTDEALSQQETLVAGMLRPAQLLEILQNFVLFTTVNRRRVKVVARYQQYRAVRRSLRRLEHGQPRRSKDEFDGRGGIIWHTQGSGKSLTMVFLVRAMRNHPRLRTFKVVFVTDRKQLQRQLSDTAALTDETPNIAGTVRETKEYLSYRGKDLVFVMIQKYRDAESEDSPGADETPQDQVAENTRTMPTLGELNPDQNVLVLIDEAHRSQASQLHASMVEALPHSAVIGFTGTPIVMGNKKRTTTIFGDYIDSYTIKQSQEDGTTVPVLYEGKTVNAGVRDAEDLDELFEDAFAEHAQQEVEQVKQRWATKKQVLKARELLDRKAKSMLWHYIESVLPNGFKTQVVAVDREAAVLYRDAFVKAQEEILREIDALAPEQVDAEALDEVDELPRKQRRVVLAHRRRWLIERLDFAPLISGAHNDPPDWGRWTAPSEQERWIADFKRELPTSPDEDGTSALSFVIVNSMLLTGFDAPVEQVLYLDRPIKEAELLQAIARVNRTATNKPAGYVVDYYGVAAHLKEALAAYSDADVEGAATSIAGEIPLLEERAERVRQVFSRRGIDQIATDADVEAAVQLLLSDERFRAEFEVAFRQLSSSVETVLPRPEARPYVGMLKTYGVVRFQARRRSREAGTTGEDFDPAKFGARVRELIDTHIAALGVESKIPPVSITAEDFDRKVEEFGNARTRASEMEHALRYHINEHFDEDPAHYQSLTERLREVLEEFEGQWEDAVEALKPVVDQARRGREDHDSGLDPNTQAPFFELLLGELVRERGRERVADEHWEALRSLTVVLVRKIRGEIVTVRFWEKPTAQDRLRGSVAGLLDNPTVDGGGIFDFERHEGIADRVLELARANHARLVASS